MARKATTKTGTISPLTMVKATGKKLPINLEIPTPTPVKIPMSFANFVGKEDILLVNVIMPRR